MAAPRGDPPYRRAGAVLLVLIAAGAVLFAKQFRGEFTPKADLTVLSPRAGLVVDAGAKVTFNGVEIGRVADIGVTTTADGRRARLSLRVDPHRLPQIPANVIADVNASTVFGNKYVALSSPEHPSAHRLSAGDVVEATSVTTEFNTVFETVTELAEQVDPIRLNQTLDAAAQALTGLGDRFGASLDDGHAILTDLNPRLPLLRRDAGLLADLADHYADASPDLWSGLDHAVVTARALTDGRAALDAALLASIGFAGAGADTFEQAGPYLVRGAEDLRPTAKLLDDYRGMIFCTIRNYHDVAPEIMRTLGGDNGYSLASAGTATGAGNPYIYPDNLPRVNARGGPGGRPGCWQKITRELWPMPYLVMDTGYSIAPYNHAELGQPFVIDYVWGRQFGELTINP